MLHKLKTFSSHSRISAVGYSYMKHTPSSIKMPYISNNFRMFSTKKEPKADKKQEEQIDNSKIENDEKYEEFKHDESYDYENSANFSTRRRIFFALGKAIKYSIWIYLALFSYHFYLVRNKDKPEESFGCIDYMLKMAMRFNWHVNDINILLTRPPVSKLLPDKPPMPPHMPYPKTLVIGLRGVSVKSDYKLGVGFEFKKRPGLNTFLQRLSRRFEIVVFGDEESSLVSEI